MSRQTKSVLMRSNERERLRVAATVTQEREWPQNEPNQGLARMFVVMLLIHVVVIGGVIIYDFVGQPEDAKALVATSGSAPKTAAPAPTPAPKTVASEPRAPVQEVPMTSTVSTGSVPTATPPAATPVSEPPQPAALLPDNLLKTGSTTVVDLPQAPGSVAKVVSAPALTAPPPAAEKPKTETVMKAEAPKAEKPKVEKAVALGAQPKPVMTPTTARKALESDAKRSSPAPAPTVAKKKETTPPTTIKKAATASRHTVGKGDTVYAIARRYKVSEKELMKANGITNPAALRLGKALVIPK